VTDDEAFIRAIVDSPGDDTPRLVYADWLDDRDDPRGAYLRAEREWARPWREVQRPEDSPKSRDLAAGLDPVWMARVSRPPLGVCSDHVRFENIGRIPFDPADQLPPLSLTDIETVAQELNVPFPNDYIGFLLNQNGGNPNPNRFPLGRESSQGFGEVVRFFFLTPPIHRRSSGTDPDGLEYNHRVFREHCREQISGYLAVATNWNGNYLLISTDPDSLGAVSYITQFGLMSDLLGPPRLHRVASSLAEFLGLLVDHTYDWEQLLIADDISGLIRWIESGGDPNISSGRFGSALCHATYNERWDLVAALLEHGAVVHPNAEEQLLEEAPPRIRRLTRRLLGR
jgi:uncharacterized protein (TIGR02996 family)